MNKIERIHGFPVHVKDGKETTDTNAQAKVNGPHTDAKWAKDLLGCNFTTSERKARIAKQREKERQDRARALLDLALQPQPKKKKWKPAKQLVQST